MRRRSGRSYPRSPDCFRYFWGNNFSAPVLEKWADVFAREHLIIRGHMQFSTIYGTCGVHSLWDCQPGSAQGGLLEIRKGTPRFPSQPENSLHLQEQLPTEKGGGWKCTGKDAFCLCLCFTEFTVKSKNAIQLLTVFRSQLFNHKNWRKWCKLCLKALIFKSCDQKKSKKKSNCRRKYVKMSLMSFRSQSFYSILFYCLN